MVHDCNPRLHHAMVHDCNLRLHLAMLHNCNLRANLVTSAATVKRADSADSKTKCERDKVM